MPPWTADDMRRKGARDNPARAAEIANAILRGGGSEGVAIATALARTNKTHKTNPRSKA